MIKVLEISEIDQVLEILKQDGVRGYNGKHADSEDKWFRHFFDNERCWTIGIYDKELIGVLIAEALTDNGCMIWYIAVKPEKHGKGYGTKLLSAFEYLVKEGYGVEWVYLTSSMNALEFYEKNGYETSDYSNVKEHVKNL